MRVTEDGDNLTGQQEDVFNVGMISEWYEIGTDYAFFLDLVRIGDRLEMKRNGYCHWAVFVGIQYVVLDEDSPHVLLPCVVHRNNPADDPSLVPDAATNIFSFSVSSRASAKGAYGIGDVCLQPLRDTWGSSSIRINNKLDTTMKPFPSKEVVERLMKVLEGEDQMSFTPYNVVTNNCEHFASWARNGWAFSRQVVDVTQKVLVAGVSMASFLLPRPLTLATNVAMAGLTALRQARRREAIQ